MSGRKIIIRPFGGLCNRMRAIGGAHSLAARLGSELVVEWWHSPELNASFESLFDAAAFPHRVVHRHATSLPGRALGRLYTGAREWTLSRTGWELILPDVPRPDARRLEEKTRDGRNLYIRSCEAVIEAPDMYEIFRPAQAVDRILAPLVSDAGHRVGVHIRRTDNAKAIEHSPLSLFQQRMQDRLDRDPATTFFVATDSEEALQELMGAFPGRIAHYEKRSLSRDNPLAIQDAAVDLFALAHCREVLGSYFSSFSETAARLRNIPLAVVKA